MAVGVSVDPRCESSGRGSKGESTIKWYAKQMAQNEQGLISGFKQCEMPNLDIMI